MASSVEEAVLETDPRRGSWGENPGNEGVGVGVTHSISTDAQATAGTPKSSQVLAVTQSMMRESRPSVKDCLNLPDEEMADLELDVYNMFFLSEVKSQGFWYAFITLTVKMSLYFVLLFDIVEKHDNLFFKDGSGADATVKFAQIFLFPVAIVSQEELITSFFLFSRLKYSPEIKRRHPGAEKWSEFLNILCISYLLCCHVVLIYSHCFIIHAEYIIAAVTRFADGFLFLIINTAVMLLQKDDVLALFLNFAALQFLQSIDNIALDVCLNGYWTRSLQEAAQDVVDCKFAYRHTWSHSCMQTSFFVLAFCIMLILWADMHFIN